MSKNGTRPTSFWIDEETLAILNGLVEELGMNRSEVVREGIKRLAGDPEMAEIRRIVAQLSKAVYTK